MPESFQIRESSAEQPDLTMRKPRTWGNIALRVALFVIVFVVGTGSGWYFHAAKSDSPLKEGYVVPDIAVELEGGIDDIILLFPENADALRAERKSIVSYMLNMTDPPEDSLLQKKPLLTSNIERRLLQDLELGGLELAEDAKWETCLSAIGGFVHEFMNFVASFANLDIPSSAKFKKYISRWLRHRYNEFQIAKVVSAFVYSQEIQDKVAVMWTFFIKAHKSGSLKKALYDWLVQELSTWQGVKNVVKLAVVMYGWMKSGSLKLFGDLTFFEENFKRILKAGKKAIAECKDLISFPGNKSEGDRLLLT